MHNFFVVVNRLFFLLIARSTLNTILERKESVKQKIKERLYEFRIYYFKNKQRPWRLAVVSQI